MFSGFVAVLDQVFFFVPCTRYLPPSQKISFYFSSFSHFSLLGGRECSLPSKWQLRAAVPFPRPDPCAKLTAG